MKKTSKWNSSIFVVIMPFILFSSCQGRIDKNEYLKMVLENLSQIKSAVYYSTTLSTIPGDITTFSDPRTRYIKVLVNPFDTLVGASSAIYTIDDKRKMTDFYDGKVRGTLNWEKHYVKIDSFRDNPYPFRLVYYPFYLKIREIIEYSLNTRDSIHTELKDFGDSVCFSLLIYNKHVYFHIKPIIVKNEYIPEDEISQFDIWISKSDNLPYRMRSKWHHLTYFEILHNVQFNAIHEEAFIFNQHLPDSFEIIQFNRKKSRTNNELLGKMAASWELKNLLDKSIRLNDLKSKVLMLEFTGLACGPCHQALPFLKQLAKDYKNEDFELVSIEIWNNNSEILKKYRERNKINYQFLIGDENIKKNYQINAVPTFMILDENRIIIKVLTGYDKKVTEKEIRSAIDRLLKSGSTS